MSAGQRICGSCGEPLAPQASFCRSCGARYGTPAPAPSPAPQAPPDPAPLEATARQPLQRSRSLRPALWLGGAIVLAGAGVAAAILLSSAGGSASTTVISHPAPAAAPSGGEPGALSVPTGTLEAGRYVQAGSFKFVDDAEAERERLAGAGVEVEVVASELAQELYPGFQVLLGGPVYSTTAEAQLVRQLHRDGVPSAFGRELTPAGEISGPGAIAGEWTGKLERTSSSHPGLDATLPATLTLAGDGSHGSIYFAECSAQLSLAPSTTTVLTYLGQSPCDEGGDWQLRLSGGELMLAQLPDHSDLLVLGTLARG